MRAALGFTLVAFACACWRLAWPHAATSNTVLFDREIVRILNEHCAMCHVDGGPSSPLSTYEQTWLARNAIHREVLAHRMPPWPAVPGYGNFANANALTLRETRFVVSWVEGLGPRNTGSVFLNVLDASAAREDVEAVVDFNAWKLGEPDVTVALPPAATLAPTATESRLRKERVVVDLELDAERGLRALEYRPAGRSALHAAVFTLEQTGQWLATWTPWYGYRELPQDVAFRLPAGARIVAELHTATGGPPIAAFGDLGLHFGAPDAPRAPTDIVLEATAGPAAAAEHARAHAEIEIPAAVEALALWPELPADTESLEVTARHRDGKVDVLLAALHIPPDWPTPYVLASPAELPAGSRLSVTARWSGSRDAQRLRLTVSAVARASTSR